MSSEMCKFGFKCTRADCWYAHPGGRRIDELTRPATSSTRSNALPPPAPTRSTRSTHALDTSWRANDIQCGDSGRNGARIQRPHNAFVPTGFELVLCKFGAGCTKWPDCPFLHEGRTHISSPVQTLRAAFERASNTRERASDPRATVDCKFGAGCRNYPNCSFRHPSEDPTTSGRRHVQKVDTEAWMGSSNNLDPGRDRLQTHESDAEESYVSEYGTCASHDDEQGLYYSATKQDQYQLGPPSRPQPADVDNQQKQVAVDALHIDNIGPGLFAYLREKFGQENLIRLKSLVGVQHLGHNGVQQQLWVRGLSLDPAETMRKLSEQVEKAQEELKQQVRELPMVGATRLLLGCGGKVLHVLTAQDYVTVLLTGLGQPVTESEIRLQLERFGEVSAVAVVVRAESVFARVTYREPAAALAAVQHSKSAKTSGSWKKMLPFDVKPYIPKSVDGVLSQSNRLVVSWPIGNPTGTVTVTLSSSRHVSKLLRSKDMHNVLLLLGDPYFCDRSNSDPHSVTLKLPKSAIDIQSQLFKKFRALRTALETKLGRDALVNMKVHQEPPTLETRHGADEGRPRQRKDAHLDTKQVGDKLRQLFGKHGQVDRVEVMPLGATAHEVIGRAQVWMSSPQMCKAARQAMDEAAEFGSGFMKVKWDHMYSTSLDHRTYNAIKGRIQEVNAHLSRELPGVKITIKPSHSPVSQSPPAPPARRNLPSAGGTPKANQLNTHKARPRRSSNSLRQNDSARCVEDGGPAGRGGAAGRGGGAAGRGVLSQDWGGSAMAIMGGKVCVQVECGEDGRHMPAVKAMLEPCFKGREFDAGGAEGLSCLLTQRGKAFLQELEETYTQVIFTSAEEEISDYLHIRWERLRNRLVLFGSEVKVEMAIEDIKSYLESQRGTESERRVPVTRATFGTFLREFDPRSAWLMERSGVSSVSMDIVGRGLKLVGKPTSLDAAEVLLKELQQMSPNGRTTDAKSHSASTHGTDGGTGTPPDTNKCPVCRCETDTPYCLAICRHAYCTSCLQMMMEAAVRSNGFPLKCCRAGCQELVSLGDLSSLLAAEDLDSAYKASYRSHLDTHHTEWGNCYTPDCPQIFRKSQPTFHCDICEASWCTRCQEKVHDGMTCTEYRDLKGGHQAAFDTWKRQHTKPCPGCSVPIEKNHGCNHMTCAKCRCHFCWLCTAKFQSGQETYSHLNAKHGGIFDVIQAM